MVMFDKTGSQAGAELCQTMLYFENFASILLDVYEYIVCNQFVCKVNRRVQHSHDEDYN